MKPKNKKSVLILNIILLIIFIPCAVIGIIYRSNSGDTSNKNKDFFHNGKLYFYDYENLLGNYTCTNNLCDYANETIDDDNYALNYYNDNKLDQIEMINNKYAFIIDDDTSNIKENYKGIPIKLYDITGNKVLSTVKAVKNYSVGIENNLFIIQNDSDMWGVISINDVISVVIPYEYNYIGLHKNTANNTNKLESDIFVVYNDSGWKLLSNLNVDLTSTFINPIYDYNATYVITKNNDLYYLNKYDGTQVISYGYKGIKFIGEYVGVLSSSDEFYIVDPTTTQDISSRYPVTTLDQVNYTITDAGLELTINGEVVETISMY